MGGRRLGHPAPVPTRGQRRTRGLRLRRRPLDHQPRRRIFPAPDFPPGQRDEPPVLARRLARRLQRRVRRQRRRVRHSGRRRRAEAPDLAPGRRSRPGVHPLRLGGALRLPAQHVHEPSLPALHRPADRRSAREAADPARSARQLLAGRQPDRLHSHARAFPAVEELPRRHDLANLDLQHWRPLGADDPAARGPLERHEPDLDRQPCLLPLRPGRRVQPVLLRHRKRRDRPALGLRGLPRRESLRVRGHIDLRTGRLPASLRPGFGPPRTATDRRRRGPDRNPAPLGRGPRVHSQRLDLTLRGPRGLRLSRRHPHAPPPRRATPATRPERPPSTSAFPPGRPTAPASPSFRTRAASTGSTSATRTAARSAATNSAASAAATASTRTPSGRPTASGSATSTIRCPCS